MKIAVIGYGILGKSIVDLLKDKNEIVLIDPNNISEINNHHDSDGIIICTTTNIEQLFEKLPIFVPILIRASVAHTIVDQLHENCPDHSVVIFPDLKFSNASSDLKLQKYIVLGGEDPECFWQDLLQESMPNCNLVFTCSDKEAPFIKNISDGFDLIKLAYFKQIDKACNIEGLDFNIIKQILSHDPKFGNIQINNDFTTTSIDNWANSINNNMSLIKTAIKYYKNN